MATSPNSPNSPRRRTSRDAGELTNAIGYSGRREIVDAVRALFEETAINGRTMTELADEVPDFLR